METYAAFLIGIGGGVSYMITTWLVLFKLKVDDPLDACAGICIAWSFATSNIPDIKIPTVLINLTQCIGLLCMYLCILCMHCYTHVISLFYGMSYQACFCRYSALWGRSVGSNLGGIAL